MSNHLLFIIRISKHFVIWFAKTDTARFGLKGGRVLSVTPGNFETPMGKLEKDEAGTYLKFNAIRRKRILKVKLTLMRIRNFKFAQVHHSSIIRAEVLL